jgi:hypothetical protein
MGLAHKALLFGGAGGSLLYTRANRSILILHTDRRRKSKIAMHFTPLHAVMCHVCHKLAVSGLRVRPLENAIPSAPPPETTHSKKNDGWGLLGEADVHSIMDDELELGRGSAEVLRHRLV